jgi:hypothetical protein
MGALVVNQSEWVDDSGKWRTLICPYGGLRPAREADASIPWRPVLVKSRFTMQQFGEHLAEGSRHS